jgi:hypothetical protein
MSRNFIKTFISGISFMRNGWNFSFEGLPLTSPVFHYELGMIKTAQPEGGLDMPSPSSGGGLGILRPVNSPVQSTPAPRISIDPGFGLLRPLQLQKKSLTVSKAIRQTPNYSFLFLGAHLCFVV